LANTRIQLCGRLVAEVDGERVEAKLPGRQGRILFGYLVVHRHRAAGRDELVAAVWPDGRDGGLSPLLSKLRRLVPIEGRGEVRIALPAASWVDLEAADEALHRAESALARADWHAAYGPARVAQHIAVRGFFAADEPGWVAELQRRLDGVYLRSLELVAPACLRIGGAELDTAERAARCLVELDPFRESGYRLLMEIHATRGNRAEALRTYELLRTFVRDELGVSPSGETQELHRRLLAD